MKFSRLSAIVLFWPALALVIWGELSSHAVQLVHIWDKALHFTAYFGLAGLALVALVEPRRVRWALLGLVILGGVLEIIQGHVGRDMSFYDEVANTLGVAAGATTAWLYLLMLRPRRLVAARSAD